MKLYTTKNLITKFKLTPFRNKTASPQIHLKLSLTKTLIKLYCIKCSKTASKPHKYSLLFTHSEIFVNNSNNQHEAIHK